MSATINTKQLAAALELVRHACAASGTLACVLLRWDDDGRFWIGATDYDRTYAARTAEEPADDCSEVAVHGGALAGVVSAAGPELELATTKGAATAEKSLLPANDAPGLLVTSRRARWHLLGWPVSELPIDAFDDVDLPTQGTPYDVGGLANVMPAVSTDANRPALMQARVAGDGSAVATDGHRLMVHTTALGDDPQTADAVLHGVLVPRVTAGLLAQHASAQLLEDDHAWILELPTGVVAWLVSRPIHEDYPQVARVVPSWTKAPAVTVDRELLLDAIKRLKPVCDADTPIVLTVTAEEIKVDANARDRGDGATTVEVQQAAHLDKERIRVGINPRYLRDALAALGGITVRLSFAPDGDRSAPIVVGSHIVMPMRVPA